MCNLYSITTNQEAIIRITRALIDRLGNLPPTLSVFPDYPAPIVRNGADGRELVPARWACAPRTGAAGPARRTAASLTSFSEYAPEPDPVTGKRDVVWFALDENRPLTFFAGLWTN